MKVTITSNMQVFLFFFLKITYGKHLIHMSLFHSFFLILLFLGLYISWYGLGNNFKILSVSPFSVAIAKYLRLGYF